MHLSKLHVDGFRGLDKFEAEFRPGLNVIVGPNNAGKTALVDSLRLALSPVNRASQFFFRTEDFSIGSDEATIRVVATNLSESDRALHLEALDFQGENVHFGRRFFRRSEELRGYRPEFLVGPDERVNDWYPARDRFQSVYLEPLRDAQKELASYNGNRLRRLVNFLATDEETSKLETLLAENDESVSNNEAIIKVSDAISGQFTSLTHFGSQNQPVISPASQDLSMALRRLKLGLKESSQHWELDQIGLGYANLLYFASVLAELTNEESGNHRVLLIEEPEAHLHPQLQSSLVRVLQNKLLRAESETASTQIILTTHSATLAAAAGVPALRGMSRTNGSVEHWCFKAEPNAERKLNRFFISRRPEALFAEFVLLVEGVSEEILLPTLFKLRAVTDFEDVQEASRRQELRTSFDQFLQEYLMVVAVHSVDFKPYVALLTSSGAATSPRRRVYVLTDSDSEENEGKASTENPGESRKRELLEKVRENQFPTAQFRVCLTPVTLEYELMKLAWADESDRRLQDAILVSLEKQFPRRWNYAKQSPRPEFEEVWDYVASSTKFSKGVFSQDVAEYLLENSIEIFALPSDLETVFDDLKSIFLAESSTHYGTK